MAENLNKVDTTLTIAGNKVHFVSIFLSQSFSNHNNFEIVIDFEEMDKKWMESPAKLIGLIGESVIITMKHKQTGEENIFQGIITNTSLSGHHGQQNSVIITGKSPTIKLDGKDTMDSFMNKTLQQIVDEAVANSGNGGSITSKPEFGGQLDYICQYNETCFEFLNRLSWLYGEWFFYNGTETFFGKPDSGKVTDIVYDIDMTSFNLSANLIPPKFNRYYYLHHDDKEIQYDAPDSVDGVEGYLYKSLDMSKKVYSSDANLPLNPNVLTMKELEDMVKVEKSRAAGEMLVMTGSTLTCKIKIGEKVKIKFPASMEVDKKEVDTFTITEVTHNIDQEGHYSNSFKGILSGINNIPMSPRTAPIAGPQIAWVKTDEDPQNRGRVQVQFQWQRKINKSTNWIRVQTPDAGKSGKVANNRGFVFIPEDGDMVMIGFEYGDPNRPYVSGSVFSENVGIGGGGTNKTKSLTTRCGSTVTLQDEEGSILIKDRDGNLIRFDGNDYILASANDHIKLTNGKCIIEMQGEKIWIYAPEEIAIESKKIGILASDLLEVRGKAGPTTKMIVNAQDEIIVSSKDKMNVSASINIDIGTKNLNATGKEVVNIGGKKVNINS